MRSFILGMVLGTLLVLNAYPMEGVSILSRYDYYTSEKEGELLIFLRDDIRLRASVWFVAKEVAEGQYVVQGMNRVPLPLEGLPAGNHSCRCLLAKKDGTVVVDTVITVKILPPHLNEVKIDRLTGMLVVGELPWLPFGFYTYSPVHPALPGEEVVKGFNMISPYQRILPKTLRERKAYMDRCAALGMKVHYNLLSVAGGGGVGSKTGLTSEEKRKLLIGEVKTFRDHPALLAWYIADEPVGQGVPPEPLNETYRIIKELDPYHPVTMVFMTPDEAWRYGQAMDIVMADPYPVPNRPVTEVEYVTRMLHDRFYPEKPLWLVPQAFGGGEHWRREPTPGEVRVMTWLALMNGARGIQYFIRNGRNGFPKSTIMWDECGKIALEAAELVPFLAEAPPATGVRSPDRRIRVTAFRRRDQLLVLCLNTVNKPLSLDLLLPDSLEQGRAEVMFEDRSLAFRDAHLKEPLDAFGFRAYRIVREQERAKKKDTLNMLVDPGFEYLPVPGVPSAAYVRVGKDRGATVFVDPRISHEGEHALRLVTPADRQGVGVTFFPAYLEYGHTYRFSLWARGAEREDSWSGKGFFYRLFHRPPLEPSFSLSAGEVGEAFFPLSEQWQEYELFLTPSDTSRAVQRVAVTLRLDSRGTAWFDDMRLVPLLMLDSRVARPGEALSLILRTPVKGTVIRYDTQGRRPTLSSPLYEGPALLEHDAALVAAVFRDTTLLGILEQQMVVHRALGARTLMASPYSDRYTAGGDQALVDGLLARAHYKDPHWQGYYGTDMEMTLDLGKETPVTSLSASFLSQPAVYIHFPVGVNFYVSSDGKEFHEVGTVTPPVDTAVRTTSRVTLALDTPGTKARYVKVVARNMGTLPEGVPGTGNKAWIFCDEIVVR